MMMPSIFGENLFDDDWMDFPFDRFDRSGNTTKVMNWTWTCPDSRKMRSAYS